MKLTLDNLRKSGGFVAARPVEREISWKHGGDDFTATVFVKPLSYASAVSDIVASRTGGDSLASRIAMCIVDEDGLPIFDPADITGLDADGNPVLAVDEEGKPIQKVDSSNKPLFDAAGEPVYEEQGPLNHALTMALLTVIGEVTQLGKPPAKSTKKKSSGTNS